MNANAQVPSMFERTVRPPRPRFRDWPSGVGLALLVCTGGCRHGETLQLGPSAHEPARPPDSVCQVWMKTWPGPAYATVVRDHARLPWPSSGQAGAVFARDGVDIDSDARTLFGPLPLARFEDEDVVVFNPAGHGPRVHLADHAALFPTRFGPIHLTFNDACSTREAALGVVALITLHQRQTAYRPLPIAHLPPPVHPG